MPVITPRWLYKVHPMTAAKVADKIPNNARPIRLHKVLKEEESWKRNFDCTHYPRCLELAALYAWTSFTCEFCPYYKITTVIKYDD